MATETSRLKALARHPGGIQVTLVPNQATIDFGYGHHWRVRAEMLCDAIERAEKVIIQYGRAETVDEAIKNIVFQDALEAAG